MCLDFGSFDLGRFELFIEFFDDFLQYGRRSWRRCHFFLPLLSEV